MSSERPRHSHDFSHFGQLETTRVISEAMTNFDAGTPIEEILAWLHHRLSLMEDTHHTVSGFSADSMRFQPTFTIDAIREEIFPHSFTAEARVPLTPVDPKFIYASAWLTGHMTAAAFIKGIQPHEQYLHYDTFTNQMNHTWGDADTIGSYSYSMPGGAHKHEWFHLKADFDTDPLDEVYDYQGYVYEELDSFPVTYLHDTHITNKEILVCARFSHGSNELDGINQRIWIRGSDTYLEVWNTGAGDGIKLVVDGTERYSGAPVTGDNYRWYKIQAMNNVIRFKVWYDGSSEPSTWTSTYKNATIKAGVTALDFNGKGAGIIVYKPNGAPWSHYFKHISVKGINAGPLTVDALILPAPFSASAWLSSGDDFYISAFVLPTFRINAQFVTWVQKHFTIGAFKQDRVPGSFTANAFKQGYMRLNAVIADDALYGDYTADAWKVITTTDSVTADAIPKDVDRTYVVTADMVSKDTDRLGTYTVDAYKNLLIEDDFTIDAELGPGAHPPFDAVKKEWDIEGSHEADATFWPADIDLGGGKWQRLRHFEPNAVIKRFDTEGTPFTIDASFDAEYATQDPPHWDDFDRPAIARNSGGGWGVPLSGKYTYSSGSYSDQYYLPTPSADGANVGYMYENLQHIIVYAREPKSIDRTVSCDFRMNLLGGSITWGFYKFQICGNLQLWKDHRYAQWELKCYYSGAWNTIYTVNPGGDPTWQSFKVTVTGTRIQCKIWIRGDGEPETWNYDDSPPWTPTTGAPYIHPDTTRWFASGNIPTTQQFDNWFVDGTGYPFDVTGDAVIRDVDREGSFSAGAHLVPQPFSMDAFVLPTFRANARIWLGTTFPADSIKHKAMVFDQTTYKTMENVANTTYWSHNSVSSVGSDYVVLINYVGGDSASVMSKVTFGSTFPVGRTFCFDLEMVGSADEMYIGVRDGSYNYTDVGSSGLNVTGFYGVDLDLWNNRIGTVLNGAEGNYAGGIDPDTPAYGTWSLEFKYVSPTQYQMVVKDGVTTVYTSPTLTTPTWSNGWRFGIGARTGGSSGRFTVRGTPYAMIYTNEWDGLYTDARIRPGAHIPFDAQITGKNLNAIIQRPSTYTFDTDAVRHVLGEQLKSFMADAWTSEKIYDELVRKVQFGWLSLGRYMWGDVTPEYEQWHMVVTSVIKAYMGDDFSIDSEIVFGGAGPINIDSIIKVPVQGDVFSLDAIIHRTWEALEPFIPSTSVTGDAWSRNSCVGTSDDVLTLSSGFSDLGGVYSIETMDGSPVGHRVYFDLEISGGGSGASMTIGVAESSTAYTNESLVGVSGTYGFVLNVYSSQAIDLNDGTQGSYTSSVTVKDGTFQEWSIDYLDVDGYLVMKLYKGSTLIRTSDAMTMPSWDGWRIGASAYGAGSGSPSTFKLQDTPQSINGDRTPITLDANIRERRWPAEAFIWVDRTALWEYEHANTSGDSVMLDSIRMYLWENWG
jgi:hypothetical protein